MEKNFDKVGRSGEFWGSFSQVITQNTMTSLARTIYVGKHQRNLDSKSRLAIPSKWRFDGDTEDGYLALPDPSGCILVLPPQQMAKLYDKIEEQQLSDEDAQELQDKLFSQAAFFSCDKQGRINMPEELLEHSGITKEAVLIGRMINFRIWSPERWNVIDPKVNNDDLGKLMKRVNL
ncbi:MAG: MraZ protein [Candidatus Pelagisphaera sp.]